MAYYRRRRTTRMGYGPSRRVRSRRVPRGYSVRGRGRARGRARVARQEVRLVIQTPTDMLPPRPTPGGFARVLRRARF